MSKETVSEKDKPFYIALILVVGFLALIFLGAVGVIWNNTAIEDYVKEISIGLIGMLGPVIGFYFKTKS